MNLAQELIEKYEGLELTAYKDSLGFWTIGYGHYLDQSKDWTDYTITIAQADSFLAADMAGAVNLASQFPYFSSMNEVRQAALISMCYQLGDKPFHWPMFMASLGTQDYIGAARNGLNSEWAIQTPIRAQEEMAMLSTGVMT